MKDEVLELDVQLDKKTLDRFLLRNNFLRAGGVIGILISLAAIVGLLLFWKYFASHAFNERTQPVKNRGISKTVPLYIYPNGHVCGKYGRNGGSEVE